ncbi:MAG: universal stress protein [Haloarculaceae archaeon]
MITGSPDVDRPTVLVPVQVLEGESIPEGVPAMLANAHVVLLGYHEIPDQTAPGQAQMQFQDEARARLEDIESLLEDAGATVETRLVFTHGPQKTIDRQIYEHEALAVLVPDAVPEVETVLVAVRGAIGVDRIARLVAGLFAGTDVTVRLHHVAEADETDEDAETLLEGVRDRLETLGVAAETIETNVERDEAPLDSILEASEAADVIVMGETDPSLATFFFGLPANSVAERFPGPVLVVQRPRPDADDAANGEDP